MRTRAHVLIRFLTCPFLRVLRHLPSNARLLDIGAGHLAFSVLARENGARPTAVDPDARKVRKFAGINGVIGYDDCIRGTFDAIAIIDVLYKMPLADWDPFLDRVKRRLKPASTLLIKEHDPTARVKHSWNRLQERLATALHLTLGESFSYENPRQFVERLRRHGLAATYQRIDRGYPHPHILFVARLE